MSALVSVPARGGRNIDVLTVDCRRVTWAQLRGMSFTKGLYIALGGIHTVKPHFEGVLKRHRATHRLPCQCRDFFTFPKERGYLVDGFICAECGIDIKAYELHTCVARWLYHVDMLPGTVPC